MPTFKNCRYDAKLDQDWEGVMETFKSAAAKNINPERIKKLATISVTKTGGNNVLHVAALHGARDNLKELVDCIKKWTDDGVCKEVLSVKNENGYTPLHYAASRGSLEMCKCIISDDDYNYFYTLVLERNNLGETPLFLAALHGHKRTFHFLHRLSVWSPGPGPSPTTPWRRNNGDTILHCTISREYFELSFKIIQLYKEHDIAVAPNEKGITPLHVLASKPSAFKSGTHSHWFTKVLYTCTRIEPLQKEVPSLEINTFEEEGESVEIEDDEFIEIPQNYDTCHNIYGILHYVVTMSWKGRKRGMENSDRQQRDEEIANVPRNYATLVEFLNYICRICGLSDLSKIRKVKEKHVWGFQVMDELVREYYKPEEYAHGGETPEPLTSDQIEILSMKVDNDSDAQYGNNQDQQSQQGKKLKGEIIMTPLLIATKNGVIEMVKKILEAVPLSIHETTPDKKNILLVAVENRQTLIFDELKKYHEVFHSLIEAVDDEGNNALHLVAKDYQSGPSIFGPVMQMLWEIKWYKFVEDMVPSHLIYEANNKEEIPIDIFIDRHTQMAKEGGKWLKYASDSYSIAAALIASVSYATACSVPGGNDDKTGRPNFEGKSAFSVFTISSLVSLCFSVTALVMFLSILISRQQPIDYRKNLPSNLLLGLTFLFASIVSMLTSFCAAYFFLLKDTMHDQVFVIYAATLLPMSFYAGVQFPLYWDLFMAIFKDVPIPAAHRGYLYTKPMRRASFIQGW